jgi:hypothetical protein
MQRFTAVVAESRDARREAQRGPTGDGSPIEIRAFIDFILESISQVPPPKAARRVDSSPE